jgi:hypothetical protein
MFNTPKNVQTKNNFILKYFFIIDKKIFTESYFIYFITKSYFIYIFQEYIHWPGIHIH